MKRTVLILIVAALTLSLAACQGGNTPSPSPTATASPSGEPQQPTPSPVSTAGVTTPKPTITERPAATSIPHELEGAEELVDMTLQSGGFGEHIAFSLYMDSGRYEETEHDGRYYYYVPGEDAPGEIFLEIGFIEEGSADELAPAFLESYGTIMELTDEGIDPLSTYSGRHMRGTGKQEGDNTPLFSAWLIQRGAGVVTVVAAYNVDLAEGHGARLRAMAETLVLS